jgi:hypothetical protein
MSLLDGGDWLAARPCHFTSGETAPIANWIGDSVDPRAGLDAVERRKNVVPPGHRTPTHRPSNR